MMSSPRMSMMTVRGRVVIVLMLLLAGECYALRGATIPLQKRHALGAPGPIRRAAASSSSPASADGGDGGDGGVGIHQPLAKPNGSAVLPTGGNIWPLAVYWIAIEVGTPPVSFPVTIDSGSPLLGITGPGCTNCPKAAPNNVYIPSKSSTGINCSTGCCACSGCNCTAGEHCKGLGGTFSNTYITCQNANPMATCTQSGTNFQDMVRVGGLGPVPCHFGVVTAQTANFDQA